MRNIDICHEFFQQNFEETFLPNYKNVGYNKNVFISYRTAIAKVVRDKAGNMICLVSDDNFSTSTAKHINYLMRVCPYKIIRVPFEYGSKDNTIDNIIYLLRQQLDDAKKLKMSRAENRNKFIAKFEALQKISNSFKNVPELETFRHLYDDLQDDGAVRAIKALARKKAVEEMKIAKEELELLRKQYTYLQLVQMYCTSFGKSKEKLRKILNTNWEQSFVYFDGKNFCTSQNIEVSEKEGKLLLKLFKAGKLKIGYKIDKYTVLHITDHTVKIGCHLIPVENLNELAKECLKGE